ncbi:hypothetical protein [Parendozoicomonas sp. Alg238-R29]|uniref:hypothetical protein n=1 Tax=Parendozoicomonas sp. Alg238-R29 TaxID=2993446 RepID=UPI00248E29BA|nr:hypothetical protein [Parendozoicomonas sp. Alg238-R29]
MDHSSKKLWSSVNSVVSPNSQTKIKSQEESSSQGVTFGSYQHTVKHHSKITHSHRAHCSEDSTKKYRPPYNRDLNYRSLSLSPKPVLPSVCSSPLTISSFINLLGSNFDLTDSQKQELFKKMEHSATMIIRDGKTQFYIFDTSVFRDHDAADKCLENWLLKPGQESDSDLPNGFIATFTMEAADAQSITDELQKATLHFINTNYVQQLCTGSSLLAEPTPLEKKITLVWLKSAKSVSVENPTSNSFKLEMSPDFYLTGQLNAGADPAEAMSAYYAYIDAHTEGDQSQINQAKTNLQRSIQFPIGFEFPQSKGLPDLVNQFTKTDLK